ncbi:helical backbone metal receptor [Actinokineospora auranticolor]|uniref:Substrate-binding family protein n=1 Tax=Actinokineospora auranticolor TaxID=155976 RepID=A0A2S6GDU0_9PSEU|nr:helical backbone metal receptor [Actinokineospora auranticolor]PPK63402.1 substrate-binding family protein [Actinokineospora auranticolor]
MRDDLGTEVTGPVTRVVSLVPSLTEAVAVSAPGVLVGATDYCTHPSTLDVPRVGGSKFPTVAAIEELRPDLVVANTEENRLADVEALRAAGIAVWVMEAPVSVPAGIESTARLLAALGAEPAWLGEAREVWASTAPVRAAAVVPVWRKPWVVVGRDTFAGDVLRRLGVVNAYAEHADRYPRPSLDELNATSADLVVLPDEPYAFTADDGPGFFPGKRAALVVGRYLTWYGPSLVEARTELDRAITAALT